MKQSFLFFAFLSLVLMISCEIVTTPKTTGGYVSNTNAYKVSVDGKQLRLFFNDMKDVIASSDYITITDTSENSVYTQVNGRGEDYVMITMEDILPQGTYIAKIRFFSGSEESIIFNNQPTPKTQQ